MRTTRAALAAQTASLVVPQPTPRGSSRLRRRRADAVVSEDAQRVGSMPPPQATTAAAVSTDLAPGDAAATDLAAVSTDLAPGAAAATDLPAIEEGADSGDLIHAGDTLGTG